MAAGISSIRIAPPSMATTPPRMFISVLLPAPMAPISAIASPRKASRCTPRSACTPGNVFVMASRTRCAVMASSRLRVIVGEDENDDHGAFDHQAEIIGYAEHVQRVADQRDENGPYDRAERTPDAAIDADAADDTGADRVKHHAIATHSGGGGTE